MNDRADTDPLTGLVSRRGFFDDLHAMIAGSRPLGLVQVDVANVKPLAARSGTAAADKVLVEVGGHLSDLCPAGRAWSAPTGSAARSSLCSPRAGTTVSWRRCAAARWRRPGDAALGRDGHA